MKEVKEEMITFKVNLYSDKHIILKGITNDNIELSERLNNKDKPIELHRYYYMAENFTKDEIVEIFKFYIDALSYLIIERYLGIFPQSEYYEKYKSLDYEWLRKDRSIMDILEYLNTILREFNYTFSWVRLQSKREYNDMLSLIKNNPYYSKVTHIYDTEKYFNKILGGGEDIENIYTIIKNCMDKYYKPTYIMILNNKLVDVLPKAKNNKDIKIDELIVYADSTEFHYIRYMATLTVMRMIEKVKEENRGKDFLILSVLRLLSKYYTWISTADRLKTHLNFNGLNIYDLADLIMYHTPAKEIVENIKEFEWIFDNSKKEKIDVYIYQNVANPFYDYTLIIRNMDIYNVEKILKIFEGLLRSNLLIKAIYGSDKEPDDIIRFKDYIRL